MDLYNCVYTHQGKVGKTEEAGSWFSGFGEPAISGDKEEGKNRKKHEDEDDEYNDNELDDSQKDYHKEDDDGYGGRTDAKDNNRIQGKRMIHEYMIHLRSQIGDHISAIILHITDAKEHSSKKNHKGAKLASFSGYGADFLDSDEFMRNFGITLSVFGSLASSGILSNSLIRVSMDALIHASDPEYYYLSCP